MTFAATETNKMAAKPEELLVVHVEQEEVGPTVLKGDEGVGLAENRVVVG